MMKQRYMVWTKPSGHLGEVGLESAAAGGEDDVGSMKVEDLDPKDLAELRRDPGVELAADMKIHLIDPVASDLDAGDAEAKAAAAAVWGIGEVGADASPFNGKGAIVAVLDTGIDPNHPAFKDHGIEIVRKNFTQEKAEDDLNGHGTHCAGTIFGRDVDGKRIGVAPGVTKVLVGKVLTQTGGGSTVGILEALVWAVENRANIISLSLGIDPMRTWEGHIADGMDKAAALSETLSMFTENLRFFDTLVDHLSLRNPARGTLIVAATGNESRRPKYVIRAGLPAAAKNVVSVGAVEKAAGKLSMASFSNTHPTLVAPGKDILSARLGGGLTTKSGTSMATPHVAGLAALWFQAINDGGMHRPSAELILEQLRASAVVDRFAADVRPFERGRGIPQAPKTAFF